ncbi:MAG TPA: rhodanese-like domain-containing protein [Thermoanaerobaculia bacterium]|nr:rhodanese-like domain-containing protein [Thermoanaerobaculia bacterium]
MLRALVVLLAVSWIPGNAGAQELRPNMLVSTNWLALHGWSRSLVVLDVAASHDEYAAGHIPGARFVPMGDLVATVDGTPNEVPRVDQLQRLFERLGIGNRARVIVYARDPLHVARLYFTLDYLGHGDRVALLDGGFSKWKAERRPISTKVADAGPAIFETRVRPKAIVRLAAMMTGRTSSGTETRGFR